MYRLLAITFLFASLIFLGCTPSVRSTKFQEYEPNSCNHPIIIMRTKTPVCRYEELGIISSRQRNKFVSMEEVMISIKNEARNMGGDAVIGLSESNQIQYVGDSGVVDNDPVLSGTVIRFTDRSCMK